MHNVCMCYSVCIVVWVQLCGFGPLSTFTVIGVGLAEHLPLLTIPSCGPSATLIMFFSIANCTLEYSQALELR